MKKNGSRISRRTFIKQASRISGAACMMSALPIPTVRKAFASAAGKIKIGVIAPSHCALPVLDAYHNDIYKKNGIDAEIVYKPDMPDIAAGLMGGELQVGQLISPVFFAMNAGSGPFKGKATPLVTAQVAGTNGGVLVVANYSTIKSPKDLKGKKIGVHSPLMVHNLLINTLLIRHKINPATDITIKIISMKNLIPALKSGEIDAFINPEPLGTFAKSNGVARELMITKKLWFKHPCCIVSVRRDLYEKDPDLVQAVYKSSIESGLMLNNVKTRNAHIEKIHKDSKLYSQFPAGAMKKAFMPGRSDFDPFPYQSSGKAVLTMIKEFKMMPASAKADEMVSQAFLSDVSRKLIASAGGKPPAKNTRIEKIVGKVVS